MECAIPTDRYTWIPTRQPVVIELWGDAAAPHGDTFRTITTWHNKGKDIDWNGDQYYWTKDREFERFLELPSRTHATFELATSVDDATATRLRGLRWSIVDPLPVSSALGPYRDYILGSIGEFTVARDQYVRPRTGWFSDRSACYLAAGRPVITEETGFSRFLPTGEGLFGFSTVDEAAEAADSVRRDPRAAGVAARGIAEEYFDAEKVISRLMGRAGL